MGKIQTIKYVKCEITGEMLPLTECETITLKIVKKKGIRFKIVSFDEPTTITHNLNGRTVTEKIEDVKVEDETKLPSDVIGRINKDAPIRDNPMRRQPPARFAGVFKPAGTTGAAEEKRVV
jgi:hypothetical protein